MADIGLEGTFAPQKCDAGTLMDLRKLAGNPPVLGKHWYMVDLNDGTCKWYQSKKRSYGGYRRGGRRY